MHNVIKIIFTYPFFFLVWLLDNLKYTCSSCSISIEQGGPAPSRLCQYRVWSMWVYSICIWVYFTCILFKPLQQLDKGVMLPISQHPWFRTCFFFFFNSVYLCIYFWLQWFFVAGYWLSLAAVSKVYSSGNAQASHRGGFFSCVAWAWGCAGLLVPLHVESSGTRDWTCVPCLGRQTHPLGHQGGLTCFFLTRISCHLFLLVARSHSSTLINLFQFGLLPLRW